MFIMSLLPTLSKLSHVANTSPFTTRFFLRKGGYSATPSYTAFELLESMGRTLAGLHDALDRCDEGVSDAAARSASDVAAATIRADGGEDGTVAQAMADICSELEGQNKRLRKEKGRVDAELAAVRLEQERMTRLLPEYRLEIVRSRSAAEEAQEEVRRHILIPIPLPFLTS